MKWLFATLALSAVGAISAVGVVAASGSSTTQPCVCVACDCPDCAKEVCTCDDCSETVQCIECGCST